jgi:UDP-2,4-diacetamido-2,4,6-trideoxy-beta-L-altropyranose hydrolase
MLEFIRNEGFEVLLLDYVHPHPEDLQQTLGRLRGATTADQAAGPWLILDGYHFTPDYHKAVREAGFRLLVIDDMAHLPEYRGNVILNQNIHAPEIVYSCDRETIRLLGCNYVLLRQDFLQHRGSTRKIADKALKIMISMGGADSDNFSLKTVQALKILGDPHVEIKIIVGHLNPNRNSIESELAGSPFAFDLLFSTTDMAGLMNWADLAVSAAGSTCWELAYMGLPAIIITTAENQKGIGQGLEKADAALNAGWHQDVDGSRLASILSEIINNSESRKAMSKAGQKLVDGQGLERVLTLMSFLNGGEIPVENHIRTATQVDCLGLWELANDPTVRKNSFSPRPIPLEDHRQWYRHKLQSTDTFMYVLDVSGVVAGQIRYDKVEENCAEVHFSVHSGFRGRSLGRKMIEGTWQKGCKGLGVSRIRGVAKAFNKASVYSFMKAGFTNKGQIEVSGEECLIFEIGSNG